MKDDDRAFLAGLAARLPATGGERLNTDSVNRLGAALGLDGPGVLAAVEALKAEDLIDLHWGPTLALTDKGRRAAAEPEPGAGAGASGSTVGVAPAVHKFGAGLILFEFKNCDEEEIGTEETKRHIQPG